MLYLKLILDFFKTWIFGPIFQVSDTQENVIAGAILSGAILGYATHRFFWDGLSFLDAMVEYLVIKIIVLAILFTVIILLAHRASS